jgi:hypothetical protein
VHNPLDVTADSKLIIWQVVPICDLPTALYRHWSMRNRHGGQFGIGGNKPVQPDMGLRKSKAIWLKPATIPRYLHRQGVIHVFLQESPCHRPALLPLARDRVRLLVLCLRT